MFLSYKNDSSKLLVLETAFVACLGGGQKSLLQEIDAEGFSGLSGMPGKWSPNFSQRKLSPNQTSVTIVRFKMLIFQGVAPVDFESNKNAQWEIHTSRYDFFYLPMDVRNKTNVGAVLRLFAAMLWCQKCRGWKQLWMKAELTRVKINIRT